MGANKYGKYKYGGAAGAERLRLQFVNQHAVRLHDCSTSLEPDGIPLPFFMMHDDTARKVKMELR